MAKGNPNGRPLKSASRRLSINVYLAIHLIETVEGYVEKRRDNGEQYTRSDFFNEAATKYLNELGVNAETSEQGRGERDYLADADVM